MKHTKLSFCSLSLFGGLALLVCSSSFAAGTDNKDKDKVFYRYVNAQGIKVVSQSIPPLSVRNGYEVISVNGDVLRSVAPSPSDADAERVAQDRKAAKAQEKIDQQLRRSYSSVADIESAKQRTLGDLKNNIDILQGSLLSIKSQLRRQESNAANIERSGKTVSPELMTTITKLRAQEQDIGAQIVQRNIELKNTDDKFEQDKKRFIELTSSKPAPAY